MHLPAEDDAADQIAELADLDGMDPATPDVIVLAEHRRSYDGPAVYGPFYTAAVAHDYVVGKYRTGDFDVDGCTVEYKTSSR